MDLGESSGEEIEESLSSSETEQACKRNKSSER